MVYIVIAGGLALTAIVLFSTLRFSKPDTIQPHISAIYGPDGGIKVPINRQYFDRETILKIAGPLAAVLPVLVGLFQFAASQRERTENEIKSDYIRATQLLTDSGQAHPMAGIAALTQLAENSVDRTWLMTESVSAFVRYTVPRSDSSPSQSELSPYLNPPCKELNYPDEKYDYSKCSPFQPIYQKNPAVQAALDALGNRNPQNETRANVPRRFKSQLEADNRSLPTDAAARNSVIEIINTSWVGKHRMDSNTQLVLEVQYPILQAYPDILKRPWLNLSHSLLVGLEMTAPFLEGGKFRRSDLSFSKLGKARLAKADLSEAWLVGVSLFGADLRGATLEHADVRGADLGRTDLRNAWMSGGHFYRANFWQADLSGAYLVASDMREIETMAGARLDWIIAYRADFSDSKIAGDPNEVVCMRHAFLREAVFRRAFLRGADLEYSEMQDADFSDAQLSGADFRGVTLEGAILEGADLSGDDLRGVDLTKVHGTPSRIEGALVNNMTAFPPSWPATFAQQVIANPSSPRVADECAEKARTY
jgi:uncharacterized protein YjbI with pentapeptide repeats